MLNTLRHARDVISLEAVSGEVAADKAAARLPQFLIKASDFLKQNIFNPIGTLFAIKDLAWLAMNAQRRPYSEMRGLPMRAPQGFRGSLAEYGKQLEKAVEELDDLQKDVLDPFGVWIAQRISDPASMKSLTNTLRIPGLQAPKLAALKKALDRFFPDKIDTRDPIYGDLFKRQNDWAEINGSVKKLNTIYQNGKYEKVGQKVAELSDLMDVLAKRLAEDKDGEGFAVSSVTTEQLSKVTYEVAEMIEYYGVVRHRVEEYLKVIADNVGLAKEQY